MDVYMVRYTLLKVPSEAWELFRVLPWDTTDERGWEGSFTRHTLLAYLEEVPLSQQQAILDWINSLPFQREADDEWITLRVEA